MIVLGVNGIDDVFHDSSATLVIDGTIVASVEEERFNRKKHSSGLPFEAIEYCLRRAGIRFADVDHVGYYLDPDQWIESRYTNLLAEHQFLPRAVGDLAHSVAENIRSIDRRLAERFGSSDKTQFHFLNHHLAHASSAYRISGFERAAVLTIDGAGERESCALFRGEHERLDRVQELLVFPQSLGIIYNVVAAHLGLGWVSGPGKLMGLAGYGVARPELFADVIRLQEDPHCPIQVDLSFFDFVRLAATWSRWTRRSATDKRPLRGGTGFSRKAQDRFGPANPEGSELSQVHCDLAASVQVALERAVLHLVRHARDRLPAERDLCLAGGVALNVTTNRRILDSKLFERVFITPPAYDGGTSLGCALHVDAVISGRSKYSFDVYSGPEIEEFDLEEALNSFGDRLIWEQLSEQKLVEHAADCLASNRLVGWVQGRMECGPRALGNRSILANAMAANIKDQLNARVKKREAFRPYAPSVLREECTKWFDIDDSPYMLLEARVRPEKRALVPGIVHVDGSSRPQTVTQTSNPKYYRLLQAFFARTGVPLFLNTSFNRHGEPLVNRPEEAIAVLLETDLDDLFLGSFHVRRASHLNVSIQ